MKITNQDRRAREIAATGQIVEPGETVEVDDDLGRSLCEQPANWAEAKPTKSKASAAGESKED